jgi:predicted dehydrogenase
MKKKNCIIVGLGRIGLLYDSSKLSKKILTHAKAVDNSKKINLLAGVDNNPKSLKIFKKRYNKSLIFNNINKLNFKQKFKIDLVIIATPAHTHYTLCKKIIAKIKPKVILCEKPLERNYIKGKKLIEFAKKNNVKLKVNFIRRCDPSANKIIKIIK